MTSAPGLTAMDTWERQLPGPPVRLVDVLAILAALAGFAAVSHVVVWAHVGPVQNPAQSPYASPMTFLIIPPLVMAVLPSTIQQARRLFRRHTRWLGGDVICRFEGDALRVARRWRWLGQTAWIDLDAPAEVWVFQEEPDGLVELVLVDDRGQHAMLGVVDARETGEALARDVVAEAGHRGASWTWCVPDAASWRFGRLPDAPAGALVEELAGALQLALDVGHPQPEPQRLGQNFRLAIALGILVGVFLVWLSLLSAGTTFAYVLFGSGFGVALLPVIVAAVYQAQRRPPQSGSIQIAATPTSLHIRDANHLVHGDVTWRCHPRWLVGIEATGNGVAFQHRFRNGTRIFKQRSPCEQAWIAAHLRRHYQIPRCW